MNMVDGKVKPDSRKGKVQIIQEGDAKIFQWLENGKTDPEIVLIYIDIIDILCFPTEWNIPESEAKFR